MSDLHLTARELDIMGVLWELGEATVNEVRDRVDPGLAYTSVSTMIRTLELKGYVSHRRGESVLARALDKIYGGSPIKLLAHLVSHRRLTKDELARMRAMLEEPKKRR
jgi:BlaI family transcriptional regulator, penicillinase repressor